MTTRRSFIQRTASVVLVAASASVAPAAEDSSANANGRVNDRPDAATSRSPRIKSVVRRENTLVRFGGNGGFSAMTWAADDRQLVAANEGGGWPGVQKDLYFCSALLAAPGSPRAPALEAVPGYPVVPMRDSFRDGGSPPYYGGSLLAVDGRVYQFLSTFNAPWKIAGDQFVDAEKRGTKLIYSADGGRTWCNQDGSTPVVWEAIQQQSRQTMFCWDEPNTGFSTPLFLQMGQDYRENRDGYVYGYSNEVDKSMATLVMFRVPKAQVLDRQAYECCTGVGPDGAAGWSKDIHGRAAVHTFFPGWSGSNVVYNAPLGLYLMVGFRSGTNRSIAEDYDPSGLGFWTASTPWGPFSLIHEEPVWRPGGEAAARPNNPLIAPKWLARDGQSFWLVWTDFQHTREFSGDLLKQIIHARSDEEFARLALEYRRIHPRYRFNTQRVDLVVTSAG